ncbi:4-hydroxythreonine-4-phosphate dehydrogenase PdxA [Chelatococcus sp. SYSU_G07232]|uniref:4-hydroxythreonine-4-phosphate dehydrogenase PdxA n=1 Tax=Chelatococcus albus TaxID=3047466 RepID=A0ABT7AI52_9HYPH|nr:4-hydroxythreonine-4-phosphate dehydrogenase PdxA [Chelatococcus sp. SYSU_G07232]MDJ1158662.1 4-hydroxythreonine-4-phosphate dehydrogenase PdxA [Chelatococcus sp. SYSU_G07232]
MGDPAGISPELTAKLLALDEIRAAARLLVIGDIRVLRAGAAAAQVEPDVLVVASIGDAPAEADRPAFIDLAHLDPATIELGTVSERGGRFALTNFRTALELAAEGAADAVVFTPFNKAAMRLAHPSYDDEIGYSVEIVGASGPASEFNILDDLWNARVTSHVPLKDVASLLSVDAILRGITLTDASLRAAGIAAPRIAVAGLNPHAGDGGSFGREEIEVIGPAVEKAKVEGFAVDGPFPSDTVFVRARGGAFDAVLTMYHDQGQIAMKLMGFDRGVTLLGGFPFPICTPAHGTAYDIAGRGIANVGAARAALLLAARMASDRLRGKAAAAA